MLKSTAKTAQAMSGEELGEKLLQSVREMNAGKAARITRITPNQLAKPPDNAH